MPRQKIARKEKTVADRTLDSWDGDWEFLDGGFGADHKTTYGVVGLYRALQKGTIVYIGRAADYNKAGLYTRLSVLRGKDQTGNRNFSARMIRENMGTLDLEVLRVGKGGMNAEYAKELKPLMVKRHDPIWNRPASRRLATMFRKEG